jgi:hypothetical protein
MKVNIPFYTLAAAGVAERLTTFTALQVDKGSAGSTEEGPGARRCRMSQAVKVGATVLPRRPRPGRHR